MGWLALRLTVLISAFAFSTLTLLPLISLALVFGATRWAERLINPALALAVGLMAGELVSIAMSLALVPVLSLPVFVFVVVATTVVLNRSLTPSDSPGLTRQQNRPVDT